MNKRLLACLVATLILGVMYRAEAQQPAKMHKIGWLFARPPTDYGRALTLQALRELGYVEGKNTTSEYRFADNRFERLPSLADELIGLKVDVIFAASVNAARAAKQATKTIPIVFVSTADPIVAGLVDTLARPGGNLTGFTTITPVLTSKRLDLLRETFPGVSHVALLWNPKNPGAGQDWKESQVSAKELGLQLHSMEVSAPDKFEAAFAEAVKANSKAIAVTLDGLIISNQERIAGLATKHRIPVIYPRGDFTESGGLMSYGPDQTEPYKRIAAMVDKILKGTKPTDIPVEQPKKFEFIVNLKTAKQIGLTIPPNVLARADKVIK